MAMKRNVKEIFLTKIKCLVMFQRVMQSIGRD
jgi:hypothetical protein